MGGYSRAVCLQAIVRVYVREKLDTKFPWQCQEIELRDEVVKKLMERIPEWTKAQVRVTAV